MVLILVAVGDAAADYADDVGYTALAAELGGAMPDGTGIAVGQIEVCNGDPCAWAPDPQGTETITAGDGGPAVSAPYSGHATSVGQKFYGDQSTSSALGNAPNPPIIAWEAIDWVTGGYLRAGQPMWPKASTARITNHSWVASFAAAAQNLEVLRRIDWLIARDEQLQVVGFTGGSSPMLASAFNVVSVNSTGKPTNAGARPVLGDAAYEQARTRPDLVAPGKYTSVAVPRVASAAALLAQTARDTPALSNGSTTSRAGTTIPNASRSEVLKAILMTGADRTVPVNSYPDDAPASITGYRAAPVDQTDNGLDRRYGAGQLNIYNNHHIIAGGEQDSTEDDGGGGEITAFGFDYDPAFGGASSSNPTGTYFFQTGRDAVEFISTLAWNIDIDPGPLAYFDRTATLRDFDLALYDTTDNARWTPIAVSQSRADNTETIRATLSPNTPYALRVSVAPGQSSFQWDYGIAWRTRKPGDINGDNAIDAADLVLMERAVIGTGPLNRPESGRADVHPAGGDGQIDVSDLVRLQQLAL